MEVHVIDKEYHRRLKRQPIKLEMNIYQLSDTAASDALPVIRNMQISACST